MAKAKYLTLGLALLFISSLSGAMDFSEYDSLVLRDVLEYGASGASETKAMKELSMRGDTSAVRAIMAKTQSPYLNVRLSAIRALGRYRDPNLLSFFEDVILDLENNRTPQERMVAIKCYVTINGYDPAVLADAKEMAVDPIEIETLDRALQGRAFRPIFP